MLRALMAGLERMECSLLPASHDGSNLMHVLNFENVHCLVLMEHVGPARFGCVTSLG